MAQNFDNSVGNTPEINTLTTQLLEKFSSLSLFADEASTIFGNATMLVFDNSIKCFPEHNDIIITKNIVDTNNFLNHIYKLMATETGCPLVINKTISSNNGERSFDVQVLAGIVINGENRLVNFYINLTQGSNKVKRKEKKVNKIIAKAKQAELEHKQIIENSVEDIISSTEKLKIKSEEVEQLKNSILTAQVNLEKAIHQKIESFWVRKFSIMFIT